jgi:hypothetical protein
MIIANTIKLGASLKAIFIDPSFRAALDTVEAFVYGLKIFIDSSFRSRVFARLHPR